MTRRKPRVQTTDFGESLTIQSDSERADINRILRQYKSMGIIDHLNHVEGVFADVTAYEDYGEVIRAAKAAEVEFMKLPSKVREVFNHDVAFWLDCAHDDEKRASIRPQLERLGLLEPQESVPDIPAPTPDPPTDS